MGLIVGGWPLLLCAAAGGCSDGDEGDRSDDDELAVCVCVFGYMMSVVWVVI